MMKVIFLDIDGVLNSMNTFKDEEINIKLYNLALKNKVQYRIQRRLLDIDFYKLQLLKEIIFKTNAKIVISSSWRNLSFYPLIEEYLVNQGLPIIGTTPYINGNRGKEIRKYLMEHLEIKKFIILDDEIFEDFNELENYLVKTDFYNDGLEEYHVEESVKILNKK